jgi:hypothetical protein
MTRYYFDIRDGKAFVKDDEGMELPDIADAQIEAAEFLADVANELSMRTDNPAGHPMSIEVRDSEGPLFLLSFDFLRRSA